jgi:sRNA-binding carbon storage regulator CsrA
LEIPTGEGVELIEVCVLEIRHDGGVRLGFTCARRVRVDRQEVAERRRNQESEGKQ